MSGLLAWTIVFWAVSLPYALFVIGSSFDNVGEVVSVVLVTILAWILGNKAERRVNHYYANRRSTRG